MRHATIRVDAFEEATSARLETPRSYVAPLEEILNV